MHKKSIFYFGIALATLLILAGLPAYIRYQLGYGNLAGFFSDALIAFIFFYPLISLKRRFKWPILLLWFCANAAGFELFKAMLRLPSWPDLLYLDDAVFINNSLFTLRLVTENHLLLFGLGFFALILMPQLNTVRKIKHHLMIVCASIFVLLACHTYLFSKNFNSNIYAQYNPLHWLFIHPLASKQNSPATISEDILHRDLNGTRYFKKGKAKNVLIIAMEGIPGSYITQSRHFFNLPQPQNEMPLLSNLSKQAMVVPDFVAHSHQTIRGLYAMLCSDVSKLSWSTPKATQLQNVPQQASLCLPNQLKKNSYTTHYLQASGLSFMGKDKFMPLIGFDEVHGLEWFDSNKSENRQWGVDDQTFFDGALTYLDTIKNSRKPWLLTLLTVGTHHPYEVSDEFAKNYWDRKQASIAFLDMAISHFMDNLKKKGFLENTLVILTADESHGTELGDWSSSWVPLIVFAPENTKLPKLKSGNYGLLDITLSVLDYLKLEILPSLKGRSIFRNYTKPRILVSFTADRLRWLDENGQRIECTYMGKCQKCDSHSIIGPSYCSGQEFVNSKIWIEQAQWLDNNLSRLTNEVSYQFSTGKKQIIKRAWKDQWADNLTGALYLDFPEKSKTKVHIKWTVHKAPPEGLGLSLFLKQAEQEINEKIPKLETLHEGESGDVTFEITSREARSSFSFHLLAEAPGVVEISDFLVTVSKDL
ncbi:LTA synthase family protein [bacterium]|nr:LTA synthase family protein [bacterium]